MLRCTGHETPVIVRDTDETFQRFLRIRQRVARESVESLWNGLDAIVCDDVPEELHTFQVEQALVTVNPQSPLLEPIEQGLECVLVRLTWPRGHEDVVDVVRDVVEAAQRLV